VISSNVIAVRIDSTPLKIAFLRDRYGFKYDDLPEDQRPNKDFVTMAFVSAQVFEKVFHQQGHRQSTIVAKFRDYLYQQALHLCGGNLIQEIENAFHKKLAKEVWHPGRISELQDSLVNSCLNMQAVEALAVLSKVGKRTGVRNLVPSRSSIQKFNVSLERGMRLRVNSTINKAGTRVTLDLKMMLTEMISNCDALKSRGRTMEQINSGDNPIAIHLAGTCDGAKLTEVGSFLLCALKIVDAEMLAILAESRNKDWVATLNDKDYETLRASQSHILVQSSRNVMLYGWMEGCDSEENNNKLCRKFFQLLEQWAKPDHFFQIECLGLHFKLRVAFPCDLKAIWTNTGFGGGSSNTIEFCGFCALFNYQRGDPSLVACARCIRQNKALGVCSHTTFLSTSLMSFYNNITDQRKSKRMFHFRTATELSRESEEWMRAFLAEALEPLANYQYKEKRGELINLINALLFSYRSLSRRFRRGCRC
jgi:hypothetical protein